METKRKQKDEAKKQTDAIMVHIEESNSSHGYSAIHELQEYISELSKENVGDLEIRSLIQMAKKRFFRERHIILANKRKSGYKFAESEEELRTELRKSLMRMLGDFKTASICYHKLQKENMNTDIEANKDEQIILDMVKSNIPKMVNEYKNKDGITESIKSVDVIDRHI